MRYHSHRCRVASIHRLARCRRLAPNLIAQVNVVDVALPIAIVARCKTDPLWPKPVWGAEPPRASEAAEFARFVGAIWEKLGVVEAR